MEEVPIFLGREFEEVLMERAEKSAETMDPKWSIRVAKRDNAYQMLTRDFDPHRINVYIENGIIVQQMVG
jgi:hypothetical protein